MKRILLALAAVAAGVAALFAVPAAAAADLSPFAPAGSLGMIGLAGLVITPDSLRSLQQGFNSAFNMGFSSVKSTWNLLAMLVPSTTKTENYGWMKDLPGMREWVGQRVINNLETAGATLTNKKWEHTLGVDEDDIADDVLGIYTPMLQMQGEIVARHPDELVWGLLPTGFAVKGFDGQYFFDTDHIGYTAAGAEVSWSNTGGGAGAPWFLMDLSRNFMKPLIFQEREKAKFVALNQPNDQNVFLEGKAIFGAKARYVAGFGFHQLAYGSKATLDATSFGAARLALETQRRKDGSPLPVSATHLVCGPSRRAEAEAVLMKEFLAAGESNTNYKAVNLVVDPSLG
jgi:phage major head subunit gpT-like protein